MSIWTITSMNIPSGSIVEPPALAVNWSTALQQAVATEPRTYDGLVQGVWAVRRRNHNM